MANYETVFLKNNILRVQGKLRPAGEVWVDVPLPETFADCLHKMAQAAVDAKEQEMRAEILGERDAKAG